MWGCCWRCCCYQVDCTKEQQLCKDHFVTAFPSIRVFRKAHDDVMVNVSGSVTAGFDHSTSPGFWAGAGQQGLRSERSRRPHAGDVCNGHRNTQQ